MLDRWFVLLAKICLSLSPYWAGLSRASNQALEAASSQQLRHHGLPVLPLPEPGCADRWSPVRARGSHSGSWWSYWGSNGRVPIRCNCQPDLWTGVDLPPWHCWTHAGLCISAPTRACSLRVWTRQISTKWKVGWLSPKKVLFSY